MKFIFQVMFIFSLSFTNAQEWEQLGDDIIGLHDFDFTGTSVTINDEGNRIAVFDGLDDLSPLGKVRFFQLEGNNWIQFGNEIPGLPADNISSGMIKFNTVGDRLIFSSRLHHANGVLNSGGVRVFQLQGSTWVQLGSTLTGSIEGDLFGNSIAINDLGDKILVGATQGNAVNPAPGYAEAYGFVSGEWVPLGNRIVGTDPGDRAGTSVAMNANGNIIAIGAPLNDDNATDSGQIRSFGFLSSSWTQLGSAIYGEDPGDRAGSSLEQGSDPLSFNNDGNLLAVGSRLHDVFGAQEGQARVFYYDGSSWAQYGSSIDGDIDNWGFGITLSLNALGNKLIVGDTNGYNSGSVKSFVFENNDWSQFGNTVLGEEDNEYFGLSLDWNAIGDIFITGAVASSLYGESRGYARVFEFDAVLSQNDFLRDNASVLYPNPNKGIFNISFPETQAHITVNIVDLLGRQVVTIDYFDTNKIEVNENLKAGIYLVEITAGKTSETVRIMVE